MSHYVQRSAPTARILACRHDVMSPACAERRSRWHLAAVMSLFACAVTATLAPPPLVRAWIAPLLSAATHVWYFFSSMLVSAAPFLTCGALGAAIAEHAPRFRFARLRLPAMLLGCSLLPTCDCCMNAAAAGLRTAPRIAAAFVLVWGSCCNPLALWCTALVLGWRLTVWRVVLGLIVAALTAIMWSRLSPSCACAASDRIDFTELFVRSASGALSSFSFAAAASAVALEYLPAITHSTNSLLAAAAGSILSPCSSADAVLARVMFEGARSQLAFIVAAQCADVRQLVLINRWFGPAHAGCAAISAAIGIAIGSSVAPR